MTVVANQSDSRADTRVEDRAAEEDVKRKLNERQEAKAL